MKHWHVNWILTIIVLIAVGIILYDVYNIRTYQEKQVIKQQETNQFLYSTFNVETIRQKYILFMRDKIIERWTEIKASGRRIPINYEKAYKIADITHREFTKYPWVPDPLYLLAIQRHESNFGIDTISEMGAKGLYQVMDLTARSICCFLGLSFYPSSLFDIDVNSRIAVKNLDLLYSSYPQLDLILAGHNGGRQIEYYKRKQDQRLMDETRTFVPNVLKQWEKYKNEFKLYHCDTSNTVINSPSLNPLTILVNNKK